jgi:hypothetical protein
MVAAVGAEIAAAAAAMAEVVEESLFGLGDGGGSLEGGRHL